MPCSGRRPVCMMTAPLPWSSSAVLMPRTRAMRCIIRAVYGSSSQMRTPGTLVGMAWKGPPVSVPGLGSHDSSWLTPPASQITRTRFSFFARVFAVAGWMRLLKPSGSCRPCGDSRQEAAARQDVLVRATGVVALHDLAPETPQAPRL